MMLTWDIFGISLRSSWQDLFPVTHFALTAAVLEPAANILILLNPRLRVAAKYVMPKTAKRAH